MGVKFWLEGLGAKPTWAGDDPDTGAAIRVDRALVTRVRGFVTKLFACVRHPPPADDETSSTHDGQGVDVDAAPAK